LEKALSDITVLDFSQLLAGPYAAMMLGDMGANVIKIERPNTGDIYRYMPFFNKYLKNKVSPSFLAWNRNKRSLAINIKDSKGQKAIYKMVEKADVIIHNFRPGVMERLGYGYEKIKEINPKIIYACNSGFGTTGPYSSRPGQDLLAQGISGIMSLTGRKELPPTPLGTGIADQLSAYHLVYGILSALHYRTKTGKGQKIEVDLLSSMLAFESQEIISLLNLNETIDKPSSGIAAPFLGAPYGVYECSDGYISIAMNNFKTLVEVLGDLSLLEYDDIETLYEQRDEIFYKIEKITKTNTVDYWIEKMLAKDLWVSKINSLEEIDEDPQVKHTGIISSYKHKKAGEVKIVKPAVTMSHTNPDIESLAPEVGEHSKEILEEFNLDKNFIEELLNNKIVTSHPNFK